MTRRALHPNLYRLLAILLIAALLLPGYATAAPVARATSAAATAATPAVSDVHYQVGSFIKATGAAPASQTVTHSLGATPKALIRILSIIRGDGGRRPPTSLLKGGL